MPFSMILEKLTAIIFKYFFHPVLSSFKIPNTRVRLFDIILLLLSVQFFILFSLCVSARVIPVDQYSG